MPDTPQSAEPTADPNGKTNAEPSSAAPAPGAQKREMLKAPPEEARELEEFVKEGLSAHQTAGRYMILAILVLAAAFLYWDKLDYVHTDLGFQAFGDKVLPRLLNEANDRAWATYQPRSRAERPEPPRWPVGLYNKIRFDIYLVGLLLLLFGWMLLRIERVKMQRNDLLVYRSMAREIEKLRLRVRQLQAAVERGREEEEK